MSGCVCACTEQAYLFPSHAAHTPSLPPGLSFPFLFFSNILKSPQEKRTSFSHTWDEEQGGCCGEDDPAGRVVHLEAAVSQLLGLLLLLLLLRLLPSSVLNSEQV